MLRYFFGGLAALNALYLLVNVWKVTMSFAPDFLAGLGILVAGADLAVTLMLYFNHRKSAPHE